MSFYVGKFKFSTDELTKMAKAGENLRVAMIDRVRRAQIVLKERLKESANSLILTKSAGYTGRKTYKLAQSVQILKPIIEPNRVTGDVVSYLGVAPYGRVREQGNLTRAVRKTYMTIPIPGKNYGTADQLKATGRSFVKESKAGNLIIFLRLGRKNSSAIPVYLLRREQYYKPQHWMPSGYQKAEPEMDEILAGSLDKVFRGFR